MTDVTTEFREGLDATPSAACPYIATSDCASAWWLGRNARSLRFTAEMLCGRVTRGRGQRMNVLVGKHGKAAMLVDWSATPPAVSYLA